MDKSKIYMPKEINNEIFPNSWLYNVPLDLSYANISNDNENENNKDENIEDDINTMKYLPKCLINILFESDSEFLIEESFSNNINNYFDLENNIESQLNRKEEDKKKENICYNLNTINIYNPYINFININYLPLSGQSNNYILNRQYLKKLFSDCYLNKTYSINSKYINNNLNNQNICSNITKDSDFVNNNCDNNSVNIKNPSKENIKLEKETKKTKKKRKKKLTDNYTIEIFGRRGWICEKCNNFNYESRKTCNRCKIVKTPIKKSELYDKNGIDILNNLLNSNNKKEWNCSICGNINYSFRIKCNRCQNPKEIINEKND